jgi:hypothetical protein
MPQFEAVQPTMDRVDTPPCLTCTNTASPNYNKPTQGGVQVNPNSRPLVKSPIYALKPSLNTALQELWFLAFHASTITVTDPIRIIPGNQRDFLPADLVQACPWSRGRKRGGNCICCYETPRPLRGTLAVAVCR